MEIPSNGLDAVPGWVWRLKSIKLGNVLIYDSLLNPKAISSWLITCLAQEEKSR